ncbi:MAG: hypothetical protein AB7F89_12275, partial [Pirellulaceae bacterium]
MAPRNSRWRYQRYRRSLGAKREPGQAQDRDGSTKGPRRGRSFGQLFVAFLALLRGHGPAIVFALATLTVATGLRLVP